MEERRKNNTQDGFDRENGFLLVVDSDTSTLSYTAMLLRRFNYRVMKAKTAQQALEITATSVPSLIITATELKDMSGLDLVQRIRSNSNTITTHCIALQKQYDAPEKKHSTAAGTVACIDQPATAELLYQAVQAAVEKRPRKNIRIQTLLPVTVYDVHRNETKNEYDATMISESGLFLRTAKPAAMNKRLSLQINIDGKIVPAETVVIYRNRRAGAPYGTPGMGLHFVEIEPHNQALIRGFIRREILQGITPCFN